MTTVSDERLAQLANSGRGIDDPNGVGYFESCAIASELRSARVKLVEQERVIREQAERIDRLDRSLAVHIEADRRRVATEAQMLLSRVKP